MLVWRTTVRILIQSCFKSMKGSMSGFVSLVFAELMAIATITISFCNGSTYVGCLQTERDSLLSFKQDLIDSTNRLSSWVADGDCCKWDAIVCDNTTGHVLELHLQNLFSNYSSDVEYEFYKRSKLAGKINPSLFDLKHLVYLNLSYNNFDGVFQTLRFHGTLSNLQYLDLGWNHMLYAERLSWLSSLPSLKHLDLTSLNLSMASNWLQEINKLSSLTVLRLSYCRLRHIPPLSFTNFSSSLTTLDLSGNRFDNYFNSSILNWLSRLRSLEFLDLADNSNLQGAVPRSWGRLCKLKLISLSGVKLNQDIYEILDIFSICILDRLENMFLSNCQLYGQLTYSQIGQAKNLKGFDISYNSISGHIPFSLGELSSLQLLDISHNKLNGTLSQIHFVNLTRLTNFHGSENLLTLKFNRDWVPPFQLVELSLRSCRLGPQFPSWLHSQKHLDDLDISSSRIVDSIPTWFWKSLSQFNYLNLSHNQIQGEIPKSISIADLYSLDLNSNNLSGPLPLISPNVYTVDLSNNALSGSIFQFLCHKINESRRTQILKLGNNSLFGKLPDCWMNWKYLSILELSNNKFTGNLPFSFGNLGALQFLHLHNNSFFGIIPTSLKNCTKLVALDIGENKFSGNFPTWMGESFSNIMILNLRSNKFHGPLPIEFCQLSSLQILDLAYNNLSGSIPKCVNNFSAMGAMDYSKGNRIQFSSNVSDDDFILNLVRIIDLSKNNFSGEIPVEVTSLHALKSLNLSHNFFSGRIPETVGDMREIESMDLSANRLSGEIPQSITSLTFLDELNLSNNKLTGRIPLGTQLQSFNASSFIGNELCGSPLQNCTVAVVPTSSHENVEHEEEVDWFVVSLALGFVVGFGGLIGPLLVNRRWRYMYCCYLDRLGDKFFFCFQFFFF